MTHASRTLSVLALGAIAATALSGCVAKQSTDPAASFTVSSTDSACDVSTGTATSGTLTFEVTNAGDQVTEFYLLAEDGLRIVGEVENIAPAASRTLTVVAQPGDYYTVCKPGMIGDVVGKAAFTVTGDKVAVDGPDAEQKQRAVDLYAAFVKDQVGALVPDVAELVSAYTAGEDERARELFPPRAPRTSASSPSPRRWATSTRASTTARSTPSPRAWSGPGSTGSRRISGSPHRMPSTPTARLRPGRTGRRRRPKSAASTAIC